MDDSIGKQLGLAAIPTTLNSEVSEIEAVTTGVFKALIVAEGVKLVQV